MCVQQFKVQKSWVRWSVDLSQSYYWSDYSETAEPITVIIIEYNNRWTKEDSVSIGMNVFWMVQSGTTTLMIEHQYDTILSSTVCDVCHYVKMIIRKTFQEKWNYKRDCDTQDYDVSLTDRQNIGLWVWRCCLDTGWCVISLHWRLQIVRRRRNFSESICGQQIL